VTPRFRPILSEGWKAKAKSEINTPGRSDFTVFVERSYQIDLSAAYFLGSLIKRQSPFLHLPFLINIRPDNFAKRDVSFASKFNEDREATFFA
jgi:hypothetical protein